MKEKDKKAQTKTNVYKVFFLEIRHKLMAVHWIGKKNSSEKKTYNKTLKK